MSGSAVPICWSTGMPSAARQVGPGQELHVGGHPDGEEHRLAGEFPAIGQGEGPNPAPRAQDRNRPGVKLEARYPCLSGPAARVRRRSHPPAGAGAGLRPPPGSPQDRDASRPRRFSDPTAPAPTTTTRPACGQTGRQALPVGQGAQGVDAGKLLPLKAQKAGPGPRGDEQAVVGDDASRPGGARRGRRGPPALPAPPGPGQSSTPENSPLP